jgi:hypothetical protein
MRYEGSNVHSSEIKIALESTQSEIWGLKGTLKENRDRVRKGTIWDMRA